LGRGIAFASAVYSGERPYRVQIALGKRPLVPPMRHPIRHPEPIGGIAAGSTESVNPLHISE
jgi:hypothetical protein